MPISNNPVEVQHFQGAERRFLELLADRGFRVVQRDVRVPVEGVRHGPQFDFLAERRKQRFAVAVKAAERQADWFFHWLARPILMLQAVHRLRGWQPLICIHVRHLAPRAVQRFRYQAKVYAPELWWIFADADGVVVSHLPGEDREAIEAPAGGHPSPKWNRQGRIAQGLRAPAAREVAPRLSFGDLDQWLIKVLLLAPSRPGWWGGPGGPIGSLLELGKLAEVSPPLVYRWAAAMEGSGYLARMARRPPVPQNLDRLIDEWRGRYRLNDNDLIFCRPAFVQRMDQSYYKEFLDLLRRASHLPHKYALSGHQACRFYRVRHSSAHSIHLYVEEASAAFLDVLQLAPASGLAAPVVLIRPRHPRSVFRAASRLDGILVCDALQVYFDLYHLPDRGREQADLLSDSVLKPVLTSAGERLDGY